VFTVLLLLAGVAVQAEDTRNPNLIPSPKKMKLATGVFELKESTAISADAGLQREAELLAGQLRESTGYKFPFRPNARASQIRGSILLTTNGSDPGMGGESYVLDISKRGIAVRGSSPAGVFYGVQTLLQALQPEIFGRETKRGVAWSAPCMHIEDSPRFKWRGMMLDVSRHFFTKQEVERMLDAMASQKMNVFHWHLTDDQGWRIEIKKYPLLTSVGAWRTNIGFKLDPKASHAYGPDGRYGGFYTQDDIREVVAYAQARHIMIVPEIEMPGHACAALKAYPQLSCTGGPFTTDLPGGVFDGIYCVGNDEAFEFIQNVLSEVMDLFPSQYIHVGGDEVLTNNWQHCPKCQLRMKQEGLHEEKQLEAYFIARIEKYLRSHGRTLIGWSEISEGGIAANAAVMDWVGGGIQAAHSGHDVVMSPLADCYFDHYQSTNQAKEPHAIGGYLPLKQVYDFEPMPAKLEPEYQQHILGAQANVWTEYMPSIGHVQYMVFPRLCALSEVLWSPRESRDWSGFERRLPSELHRLDEMGIKYRPPDRN